MSGKTKSCVSAFGTLMALLSLCALAFAGADNTSVDTMSVRTTRDITLDDAVQIALRQNPDILRARQEIERTRGLVITVRAQALPHISVASSYTQQDRELLKDFGGAGAVQQSTGNQASTTSAENTQSAVSNSAGTTPTTGAVATTTTGATSTSAAASATNTAEGAASQQNVVSTTGGSRD